MGDPPCPSLQFRHTHEDAVPTIPADSASNTPNPAVDAPQATNSTIDGGKPKITKRKKKPKPHSSNASVSAYDHSSSWSSSSSSATSHSPPRRLRVSSHRRNPRIIIGTIRRYERDVDALALPLGMSIAAVVSQVLERKAAAGEGISMDHLSTVCTLAIRESLANIFGDKFDSFVKNFEKSFRSTLMTLRLVNESSRETRTEHVRNSSKESCSSEFMLRTSTNIERGESSSSEAILHEITAQENICSLGETADQRDLQLSLFDGQRNQQLTLNQPMLCAFEKSVVEQTRSNNLKTFEIGLQMRKLRLKETQLALNSDSNLLERMKLSMGFSKASFRAEKFRNQLEDCRHSELLKKCIDCLVAGLLVMLVCLGYGTYVYSHKRITEFTASCVPSKESKSWWIPKTMATFNSGLQLLSCQVQVLSRMLFGLFMILAIAYLLLQRAGTSSQTMPVTFILLLLGVGCGFAGKLCIDTLGGSGYNWLWYWEIFCLLHLCSNIFTPTLYFILHGPIELEGAKARTMFPFWIRRFLFYFNVLMFLPLLCGFMPFASPGEWKNHFSSLILNFRVDD